MGLTDRPRRLPPLTALRAFEAASRHMSFAKAADELAVTPAALSYQIKQLEEHLEARLFRRLNRSVDLTEAGRLLRPGVAEGFEAFRRSVRALEALREGNALVVTAGPAFTAKWLAPNIFDFVERHPEIEVRIVASLKLMEFEHDGVDVAVRFSAQDDPRRYSEILIRDRLTPLCTPELAENLHRPADLKGVPLIHDDSMTPLGFTPGWGDWFASAGVNHDNWKRGARFSNADHAIAAALEGKAVVLGRVSLAEKELREGKLVAPFDIAIDPEAHFRFVCPLGNEERPALRAFRDWLFEKVSEVPDPAPRLRVMKAHRMANKRPEASGFKRAARG